MSRRAKSQSAQWRKRQERDPFVRAAREQGYRSRAAFKLIQIHQVEALIRPGDTIADLGAAPGGWTQVATRLAKPGGNVVAADLLPMQPVAGAVFVQGDFAEEQTRSQIADALQKPADIILSDLAPNISGVPPADLARAADLAQLVANFCETQLRPGGKLLLKSFAAQDEVAQILQPFFSAVRIRHPQASRRESRERFFVAIRG